MRIERDLSSGKTLVSDVDPHVRDIGFELLNRLVPNAFGLSAGQTVDVELNWATIRLHADAHLVVAEEIDYPRDPSRFVRSLTFTSSITSTQQRLLGLLNVAGQPVKASQYVRASHESIQAISVVGYRRKDGEEPFTGWEIVSTDDAPASAKFGLYSVRELATQRPEWLVALHLPASWSFRYAGRTVVDCVSPEGATHPARMSIDW